MKARAPHHPSLRAEFQPLPFLSNPHLQTLLGNWLTGSIPPVPTRQCRIALPDGDQLVVHDTLPPAWRPGDPIVLLIHGLGGSHRSSHVQRMNTLLFPRGIRSVRMDLRGSGSSMTLARRPYHAGCSDDVRAVLVELARWSPRSPLILVGFSLGGNIVLKLAGETGEHPVANLEGVAAVGPPIDLERCAQLIALPRNRIYERYFLRKLLTQVRRKHRIFPELEPRRFPADLTLRGFDDLYIAPRWGFQDSADYYRRTAALPFVPRIQIPTLILTARDDPFIAVEPFDTLQAPSNVEVYLLPHGGHLGYLGWDGAGGIRWVERRVLEWVVQFRRGRRRA